MQALALSGGGAKGAFTAGVVHYMEDDLGKSFDLAVGTSTGSLVGGPALLGEFKYLRNMYTSVENADILKNSYLGQIISLVAGESIPVQASMDPLRKLLTDYYLGSEDKIAKLQQQGKTLITTSVNARTGELTYVSSDDVITNVTPNAPNGIRPDTFINGILASASIPIFCKGVKVYENEQGHPNQSDIFWDGGVKEFIPVDKAVRMGATSVYAIPTHVIEPRGAAWAGTTDPNRANLIKILKWIIDSALNEVEMGDMFRAYAYLRVGQAREQIKAVAAEANMDQATTDKLTDIINSVFVNLDDRMTELYVIPPTEELTGEALEFDDNDMTRFFHLGRRDAKLFFAQNSAEQLFAAAGARAMGLV